MRSVCVFLRPHPRCTPERDFSAPPVSKVKPLVIVSNTRLLLGGVTSVREVWAGSTFIFEGGDLPPLFSRLVALPLVISFGNAVQGPRSAPGRAPGREVEGLCAGSGSLATLSSPLNDLAISGLRPQTTSS